MNNSILLVDGHVHVHPVANVSTLLHAALTNFQRVAGQLRRQQWQGVLLLSEMAGVDWFGSISAAGGAVLGEWALGPVDSDACSLRATQGDQSLIIIGGRQIATAEGLEVLALGTRAHVADKQALSSTIIAAREAGALVVLPWAVGKWLGTRGRLVANAMSRARELNLFPGDNSGRPFFWPAPAIFEIARKQNRPLLPGTDPLPLPGEERRVGSMGFCMEGQLSDEAPALTLKRLLAGATPQTVRPFGSLESSWRFFRNQLALRAQKHRKT